MEDKQSILKKVYILSLLFYCFGVLADIWIQDRRYQWDFRMYYEVSKAHRSGGNPYNVRIPRTGMSLRYPFPPFTLGFFKLFLLPDYQLAYRIYFLFKVMLLAGLIILWKREFLTRGKDLLFYLFLLLAYNSPIYIDMKTGNINMLEQFLIWVAFYFYLSKNYRNFCIFIFLASSFKGTPLLFLFLLFLSDGRRKFVYLFRTLSAFVVLHLISFIKTPQLYADFLKHATGTVYDLIGVMNPSSYGLIRKLTYRLAEVTQLSIPQGVVWTIYVLIAGAVCAVTVRAFYRLKCSEIKGKERIAIFLSCFVYSLILPRFQDYCYVILLIPSFFIIKRVRGSASIALFAVFIFLTTLPFLNVNPLPGSRFLFTLWEFYPLILSYLMWGICLHIISNQTQFLEFAGPVQKI